MFGFQERLQAHALQCDHCGTYDAITTTRDPHRARQVAERWKWVLDTPLGVLCPRCAGIWKAGMLDATIGATEVSSPR